MRGESTVGRVQDNVAPITGTPRGQLRGTLDVVVTGSRFTVDAGAMLKH